tara:strand:+ start:264 stop:389 length:126 start_codon:yes stop_codon:yes gene_type:complete
MIDIEYDEVIKDCPDCGGSGLSSSAQGGDCSMCNGNGQIEE